jgi:2-polyprenyl-3-methyl-5-hydroxy-6-metoxy-1,4-benzoquinol methylase
MKPDVEIMKRRSFRQRLAGVCSASFLLRKGRRLWELNSKEWNYPLSVWDKLWCGGYIILKDYSEGTFPPQFEDQALAYQNEINYNTFLPGADFAQTQKSHAIKPFWTPAACTKYMTDFNRIYALFQRHGVNPGQRLLELGCGPGWMAEMFALAGYSVLGTTISHHDVALANKKIEALRCKDLPSELSFLAQPMESVDEIPGCHEAFDAAYVYEALHHAFDWSKALQATGRTLKPGGWLLLASEPNRLHTCISYRVAKLSRTHEIGFSKNELFRELKGCGFSSVEVLRPRVDNWVTPLWILARKRTA